MLFSELYNFLERYDGWLQLRDPDTDDIVYETEQFTMDQLPADFDDCEVGLIYQSKGYLVIEVIYSFIDREYEVAEDQYEA